MNIIHCNSNNFFVRTATFQNGDVFFSGKTVEILGTKDLLSLRRVCQALSKVTRLQNCLLLIKRELHLNLFSIIKERSATFEFFILKYKKYGENLDKTLKCSNYIYSIDLINSLVYLFQDNFVIDAVTISVLKALSRIDHPTIKKCFLDSLLSYSDQALVSNLQGFNLLETFTKEYIATLGEQDRLYLQGRMQSICEQALRYPSDDFIKRNDILTVYGKQLGISGWDSFGELNEPQNSRLKEKEPKRKCIIS